MNVYNYQDRDNFLIGIPDKERKDRIYMVKSEKDKSIGQVITDVIDSEKKGGNLMYENDTFEMPVIDIDVNRQY